MPGVHQVYTKQDKGWHGHRLECTSLCLVHSPCLNTALVNRSILFNSLYVSAACLYCLSLTWKYAHVDICLYIIPVSILPIQHHHRGKKPIKRGRGNIWYTNNKKLCTIQWNLVITRSLGPWKLPCYIRFLIISEVQNAKKYKGTGTSNITLFIRGFCYIRPTL